MGVRQQNTKRVKGNLHEVRVGVGEAIRRLIEVEFRYRQAREHMPEELLDERELLVTALNQFELELGFDCNEDGVPDTVEVFQATVSQGCCRILPFDSSRSDIPGAQKKAKRRWGGILPPKKEGS